MPLKQHKFTSMSENLFFFCSLILPQTDSDVESKSLHACGLIVNPRNVFGTR